MPRIAIPVVDGNLSPHFGHCQNFVLYDVDDGQHTNTVVVDSPPHQPGMLPRWLAEQNVTEILAGGMGQRAIALFNQYKINVYVGVPAKTPEELLTDYLAGSLETNENMCDH